MRGITLLISVGPLLYSILDLDYFFTGHETLADLSGFSTAPKVGICAAEASLHLFC